MISGILLLNHLTKLPNICSSFTYVDYTGRSHWITYRVQYPGFLQKCNYL